ncbi:MAG TPA: hypothetical protein VHC68_01985 [Candidatus Paceibacterota bacterium]|nr:hypothetical protein [Candidatus Paceibacterota bacterium]
MGKRKNPPLTQKEISFAKLYNRWYGKRKNFLAAADKPRGNQFTRKNHEDLVDQFLRGSPGIELDVPELARIVRRYRAFKGADTRARKSRRLKRKMLSRHRQAKRLLKAKRRQAETARRAAEKARQYAFAF